LATTQVVAQAKNKHRADKLIKNVSLGCRRSPLAGVSFFDVIEDAALDAMHVFFEGVHYLLSYLIMFATFTDTCSFYRFKPAYNF
jgi:hypothetical protein